MTTQNPRQPCKRGVSMLRNVRDFRVGLMGDEDATEVRLRDRIYGWSFHDALCHNAT